MLVLTRKADEQILIGDDIKITLVRVRGNSVRLGIDAPRDVRIVRAELDSLEAKSDAQSRRSKSMTATKSLLIRNPTIDTAPIDCKPGNRLTKLIEPSESEHRFGSQSLDLRGTDTPSGNEQPDQTGAVGWICDS